MTSRHASQGHRQLTTRRQIAGKPQSVRPTAAYRQRGALNQQASSGFTAPEVWHEPRETGEIRYIVHPPGPRYRHAVSVDEVRERLLDLPSQFVEPIEVIQFSPMTKKRKLFPCYGMQWGQNVYLYPIEASLVEMYYRPPTPQQLIEAKMYGGVWSEGDDGYYRLTWTEQAIKDFYLNNVLMHEIGHVNDLRNTNFDKRERFAIWFAIEYGFRSSRGLR
jgi:hypothetical protein